MGQPSSPGRRCPSSPAFRGGGRSMDARWSRGPGPTERGARSRSWFCPPAGPHLFIAGFISNDNLEILLNKNVGNGNRSGHWPVLGGRSCLCVDMQPRWDRMGAFRAATRGGESTASAWGRPACRSRSCGAGLAARGRGCQDGQTGAQPPRSWPPCGTRVCLRAGIKKRRQLPTLRGGHSWPREASRWGASVAHSKAGPGWGCAMCLPG